MHYYKILTVVPRASQQSVLVYVSDIEQRVSTGPKLLTCPSFLFTFGNRTFAFCVCESVSVLQGISFLSLVYTPHMSGIIGRFSGVLPLGMMTSGSSHEAANGKASFFFVAA